MGGSLSRCVRDHHFRTLAHRHAAVARQHRSALQRGMGCVARAGCRRRGLCRPGPRRLCRYRRLAFTLHLVACRGRHARRHRRFPAVRACNAPPHRQCHARCARRPKGMLRPRFPQPPPRKYRIWWWLSITCAIRSIRARNACRRCSTMPARVSSRSMRAA